jgi:phytanoyl-CoA hydroxylase
MTTPATAKSGYFTPGQIGPEAEEFYRENGYLVVERALPPDQLQQLLDETVNIVRGRLGEFGGIPETSPEESDDEVLRKVLCIHQVHKFSPFMKGMLAQQSILDVLTRVIGPNVKCMQSMLFIKAAGKPGQAWHQDEDYIPTRDRSLAGAWIAMDDATIENGCLWVIPGSHKEGILWPQYAHVDKRFDCAWESYDFPYKDEDSIPVEVPRGSIVFFNGYLLHRSLPNKAKTGYRRCLVNHYMSAESLLPWFNQKSMPEGEKTATADYRDIVLVAGRDPYAYKGLENRARAHVRAAGDGGCGDGRVTLEEHKTRLQTNAPGA